MLFPTKKIAKLKQEICVENNSIFVYIWYQVHFFISVQYRQIKNLRESVSNQGPQGFQNFQSASVNKLNYRLKKIIVVKF